MYESREGSWVVTMVPLVAPCLESMLGFIRSFTRMINTDAALLTSYR